MRKMTNKHDFKAALTVVDQCPDWEISTHSKTIQTALHIADRLQSVDVEAIARKFHEIYEHRAPMYGYVTRTESSVPWDEVPDQNKELMIVTVSELVQQGYLSTPKDNTEALKGE